MKKQITTLEELQKEKKKLRAVMEITRHEFAQSIGTNKSNLKNYLLKNVALPAGAAGLAYSGYQMMNSSESNKKQASAQLVNKLLPLAINAFSAYFMKQKVDQAVEPQIESKDAPESELPVPRPLNYYSTRRNDIPETENVNA